MWNGRSSEKGGVGYGEFLRPLMDVREAHYRDSRFSRKRTASTLDDFFVSFPDELFGYWFRADICSSRRIHSFPTSFIFLSSKMGSKSVERSFGSCRPLGVVIGQRTRTTSFQRSPSCHDRGGNRGVFSASPARAEYRTISANGKQEAFAAFPTRLRFAM